MPIPGISASFSYSKSETHQDSHDVTSSEANRYDQHYHTSHSGNTTTTNTTNTDESDRSTTNTTTMIDRSYHVNIINSNFQPGMTAAGSASQPAIPSETGNEGEKETNKLDLNLEILFCQMSAEMEESATNFIIVAYIKKSDAMARAKFICDSFEKQYGKSFHCVIGSDFGNFVNYLKKCYIHVKVADQRVILFKTPDMMAETENKQLQSSLDEAKITLEAMEYCNDLIEEYRKAMEQACITTKPVAFVSQKHGELQKNAIKKFEAWAKKSENTFDQKHRQDIISLQTNKIFSMYDSRNKERYAVANKPDETRWISASNGALPHGAVIGSVQDGGTMILARAWHDGHLIPGKIYTNHYCCYVCHNGREYAKNTYEVLCHAKTNWVSVASNGSIPSNALPAGRETNGETLYIGRVQHNGTTVCGKVVPSLHKCYVPYCKREIGYQAFEILVKA